ncbi:hypothetical protein [Aquiflexum gelatinilyticum]|uniref:Uncharacterized protein n=1 Tax=Aquiflexum gelatinilyticum TaxID=2961943 RepID=A0A9X2PBB8_9BACT|nr:hypothetical protein [Aquiflexum gelatinilyticum]MCR9016439.1 hypothetical protein [Aquiflexum gelatinilyticum]MCS4435014.1 hypothetical protein [Aquiflexum gelatinilyticum]
MNYKTFFHYVSYAQYPLMLLGMYFAFKPYLYGLDYLKDNPEVMFDNLNSVLIFMGLGISFSSLQDTSKTQNELSKKIWQNPRKGKIAIIIISLFILILLTSGLTGFYFSETGILKDLSIGIIVLSLGMFGLLKAAIEMFENHRADKKINNI